VASGAYITAGSYTLTFTPSTSGTYKIEFYMVGASALCWFRVDNVLIQYTDEVTTTICNEIAEGYRYGFNGMEKDDEAKGKGNSYDFGARTYDSRLGRWLTIDPLASKYPDLSPFHFSMNNPIFYKDPDGREIIITIQPRDNQKPLVEIKISGVIHDETKTFTSDQIKLRMKTFQKEVDDVFSKSFDQFDVKVNLDFTIIKSEDEIKDTDHLISVRNEWKSNNPGKVNRIGGKVMFLNKSAFTTYKDRPRPHELGHWLGLLHPWDNGYEELFEAGIYNIMAYESENGSRIPASKFTIEAHQIQQVIMLFKENCLNIGNNKGLSPTTRYIDDTFNIDDYKYDPSNTQTLSTELNESN